MTTCIGVKVSDGKVCGLRCKPEKLYCGRHDPALKKPKSKRHVDRQRMVALFALVAQKIGYVPTDEDLDQKAKSKMNKQVLMEEMPTFVTGQVKAAVQRFARAGRDIKPLLKSQPLGFPRKVWMIISWYLTPNLKAYENTAMTCKTLYHLFVREKVTWYYHPLKLKMTSPRMYMFPIFRVIEFVVPDDLDAMLVGSGLPKIADVLKQFKSEIGAPKSKFEESQRMGDVVIELSKSLLSKAMEPEDEFIEEIPGAGVFTDIQNPKDIKFNDPQIVVKSFKQGSACYIVVKPIANLGPLALQSRLNKALCNYNGRSVIQLMRIG